MQKLSRMLLFSSVALAIAVNSSPALLAYAAAPTPDAPQAMPTPNSDHTLVPTSGSGKEQVIYDQVDTTTAKQKQSFGGEKYAVGQFERPFDQNMTYLPYLDIVKSTMQRADPNFIYVTVQVAAPVSSAADKPALYGLELDTNLDGRSEYLIQAEKPQSTDWTVAGVNVWKSSNANTPISPTGPAIPVTGSLGYDVNMFAAGKGDDADLAWVRMSPDKPDTVEIAFKNSLVGGEKGKFIWRPMTDGAPFSSTTYDLNVNFTLQQAGSPLRESAFYPLKEVYAVDNTCRVASGYDATGNEAGLCPLPPPPTKPERHDSKPSTPNTQQNNAG